MTQPAPLRGTTNPGAKPDTKQVRSSGELRSDLPLEIAKLIAAYKVQGRKLSPSRARRLLVEQAVTSPNPYRSLRDGRLQEDIDTPRILATRGQPEIRAAHRTIREASR